MDKAVSDGEGYALPDDPELGTIVFWATRFRGAMEATPFGEGTGNLTGFPRACCHHACELLRRFLLDRGVGEFQVICGNHPHEQGEKHQWLRKGDVVVDITADQFGRAKVIVTRNSPWHDSLKGEPLPHTQADHDRLWEGDGFWEGYADTYVMILRYVREEGGSEASSGLPPRSAQGASGEEST